MGQQHTCRGRSTSVVRDADGTLRVTYHSTEVVTARANGLVTLNSGGWRSYTTKTRMNQAAAQFDLGYRVYQKDHEWFVSFNGGTFPFSDGMTIATKDWSELPR